MTKKLIKKSLAIILAVAVMMAFSFATGTGVYAASKKTVYLPVKESYVYTFAPGDVEKWTVTNKYNKKGLLKQRKSTSMHEGGNSKTVYKRTKKGAVKSAATYNGKKVASRVKNTVNKKGRVIKSKDYIVANGKRKLSGVTRFTYYGNGYVKKKVYTGKGEDTSKQTTYYRKNGTIKKSIFKSENSTYKSTYNKKGLEVKEVYTISYGESKTKGTRTWKYKYNKKGDVIKEIQKDKSEESDGTTSTDKYTITNKYKYDKHGNILKETSKMTYKNGSTTSKSSHTIKYKWKKFKIAKKYLPYLQGALTM